MNSDIVLSDGEDLEYKEGIKLDADDLIIDGNGHYIDGGGKVRIFSCSGKNVTIKNITFKNGFNDDGGVIFNAAAALKIIESEFCDNTATYGGVLYNSEGDVTILETAFSENTANRGGAIYAGGGTLLIKQSVFAGNISDGWHFGGGGAIFNKNQAILSIIESEFRDNKTNHEFGGGGAIKGEGELTISESTFKGNAAVGSYKCYGGAIYNEGPLKITKSTFTDNTANDQGGAIYLNSDDYSSSISGSVLARNTSNSGGGALFHTDGELTVTDSQFKNNHAENAGNGGAVYNSGSLTLSKSVFVSNDAGHCGGAVFNTEGDLTVSDSSFKKNTAQNGAAISNKGYFKISECEITDNNSSNIVLNLDYLEISNSLFMDNQAEYIICNNGEIANLGIFNVKFGDNATESVILNRGKFCVLERGTFENTNFSKNIVNQTELTLNHVKITSEGHTILNYGYILIKGGYNELLDKIDGEGSVESIENRIPQKGISDFGYLDEKIHECRGNEIVLSEDISIENYEMDYYEGGIELDIDGLVIDGAGHTIDGGGKSRIFIITGDNITLKNITFKNGFTHRNYQTLINNMGSAIKVNNGSDITIENCKFINNTSDDGKGAIFNSAAALKIFESEFCDNTAKYGAAVFNLKGTLSIVKSDFNLNASDDGGAVYNSKGVLSLNESEFGQNLAKSYGGAITNKGSVTLSGCNFSENSAKVNGGAINNMGSVTLEGCDLSGNTSNEGGAVYSTQGALTVLKSAFKKNNAKSSGGAISDKGDLSITDSTLSENSVNSGSGGAVSSQGTMNIAGCTLTSNSCERDGGAVSSYGKSVISSSSLSNNRVLERGGAIGNGGDLTIRDCNIMHNTAKHGGAINADSRSILCIKNSNFEHNRAKMPPGFKWEYGELRNNRGGAIVNSGRLNIEDSAFSNNTSTQGGAIHTSCLENHKIVNCSFKDNKPDDVNDSI